MQNSVTASDLQFAPCSVRSIKLGKQMLSRASGRFQTVVNGQCLLSFPEGVAISFDWSAVGQSTEQGVEFNVQVREGIEPQLEGASLVNCGGAPLSWHEQSASLLALVGAIDWSEAVKESLAKSCLVGAEL